MSFNKKSLFRKEYAERRLHDLIVEWESIRRRGEPEQQARAGRLLGEIIVRVIDRCHNCGKPICTPYGRAVKAHVRKVDGRDSSFHEGCSISWDNMTQQDRETARPSAKS